MITEKEYEITEKIVGQLIEYATEINSYSTGLCSYYSFELAICEDGKVLRSDLLVNVNDRVQWNDYFDTIMDTVRVYPTYSLGIMRESLMSDGINFDMLNPEQLEDIKAEWKIEFERAAEEWAREVAEGVINGVDIDDINIRMWAE